MSTLHRLTTMLTLVILWRIWNTTTLKERFVDTISL